jgi:hypothetical protein
MQQVAPKLTDLLAFADSIPAENFSSNPQFQSKAKALQNVLGGVARKTHAAFAGGWGIAVVFSLAGKGSNRIMDIAWSSKSQHYEAGG